MTSGMKGFMVGIATVACTLFIGFGGGVWVADWLNETPHKLTRIEKVKGTDGKAVNEEPRQSETENDEINPLVPRKVVTQPENYPVPTGKLPLNPNQIGLPQKPIAPPSSTLPSALPSLPAPPTQRRIAEPAPASPRPDASRPAERIANKPDRPDSGGGRGHMPRERLQTTGVSDRHDVASEQRLRRANRTTEQRTLRGRSVSEGRGRDGAMIAERPGAPERPMFGLFGSKD